MDYKVGDEAVRGVSQQNSSKRWVSRALVSIGAAVFVGIALLAPLVRFLAYHPLTARTRVEYYDDGTIESVVEQRLNKDLNYVRHGVRRNYYPSGKLKSESWWYYGEPCGKSRLWAEDGTLISEHYHGPCPEER